MNIPNILTVIRFILIPVFGYHMYQKQYIAAVVVFLIAGLTDILDGYIARKYNMVTSWGKIADPLADKLMQITALAFLTFFEKIQLIVLVIVIIKEAFMGAGTIFLYRRKHVVVSANWYGKLATVIFYIAIILSIFNQKYQDVLIWIAVLSTLFALVMYTISFTKIKKSEDNKSV